MYTLVSFLVQRCAWPSTLGPLLESWVLPPAHGHPDRVEKIFLVFLFLSVYFWNVKSKEVVLVTVASEIAVSNVTSAACQHRSKCFGRRPFDSFNPPKTLTGKYYYWYLHKWILDVIRIVGCGKRLPLKLELTLQAKPMMLKGSSMPWRYCTFGSKLTATKQMVQQSEWSDFLVSACMRVMFTICIVKCAV